MKHGSQQINTLLISLDHGYRRMGAEPLVMHLHFSVTGFHFHVTSFRIKFKVFLFDNCNNIPPPPNRGHLLHMLRPGGAVNDHVTQVGGSIKVGGAASAAHGLTTWCESQHSHHVLLAIYLISTDSMGHSLTSPCTHLIYPTMPPPMPGKTKLWWIIDCIQPVSPIAWFFLGNSQKTIYITTITTS